MLHRAAAAKALMGYVPDTPFLYEKLTGREFVRFVARLYGADPAGLEKKIDGFFSLFDSAPWYYYALLVPVTCVYLIIPAALGVTLIMLLMRLLSPKRLFQAAAVIIVFAAETRGFLVRALGLQFGRSPRH